eukprot:4250326-Prymnesium_polylepis.1
MRHGACAMPQGRAHRAPPVQPAHRARTDDVVRALANRPEIIPRLRDASSLIRRSQSPPPTPRPPRTARRRVAASAEAPWTA